MINPDGVDISIYGGNNLTDSMELLGSDIRAWKANGNGIDLNRHYPALFWKKKNPTNGPASEGFGGLAPAIESEVRAMMELCNRWDYTISATFHSKGKSLSMATRIRRASTRSVHHCPKAVPRDGI